MRPRPASKLLALGSGLIALGLLGGTSPLRAQSACLAVTVAGVPGPVIFADGFESGDTAAWRAPVVPAYSTAATEDLEATVEFDPATTGEHVLELRWTLATGQLYQSVAIPVTLGASAPEGATRAVNGYPFPLRLAAAEPVGVGASPALAVTSSLPVAGTSIVDAALWGDWQLAAYLDGAEPPCAAPAPFRLEP